MIARRIIPTMLLILAMTVAAWALVPPARDGRFDSLAIPDPSSAIDTSVKPPDDLPGSRSQAAAWQDFASKAGGNWSAYIDRRTGSPALVEGTGLPWLSSDAASAASIDDFAERGRKFVAQHSGLLKMSDSELKFNEARSGQIDTDHWVVTFDREVAGIPVEGGRFVMYVVRGNLVALGADKWGRVGVVQKAKLSVDDARFLLRDHMRLTPSDRVEETKTPQFVRLPTRSDAKATGAYVGAIGEGMAFRLAWRFTTVVTGEAGTWIGKVDAVSGEILALFDDNKYGQAKGGVFPISNDGNCADKGCEVAGYRSRHACVSLIRKAGEQVRTAVDFWRSSAGRSV